MSNGHLRSEDSFVLGRDDRWFTAHTKAGTVRLGRHDVRGAALAHGVKIEELPTSEGALCQGRGRIDREAQ